MTEYKKCFSQWLSRRHCEPEGRGNLSFKGVIASDQRERGNLS
jgi:hypothetical protein